MSTPGNLGISITRTAAINYIAHVVGGAQNPDLVDMAEQALLRGFNDWQTEKDWEYLLKDASNSFTVDSCVTNSTTTVTGTAPSLDGVNIGITVSGTGITVGTTVAGYSRDSNGSITSITLSETATASGTVTLTFGATIPVKDGVSDYNLPTDFYRHYGVRLYSSLKWPLEFIRPRNWNRITLSQTNEGPPSLYTIFNAQSPLSQNKGTYRMRLYPVPSADDIIQMEYYRRFNVSSDPLDMEGTSLYKFLDYCKGLFLLGKKSYDNPELLLASGMEALKRSKEKDEEATEDEDVRMKSQMEMGGNLSRPLWTNGQFDAYYGQ